ncbi:MAG: acyl--CoA ligase [Oscillospiraceae bacterium]|jgi:acyl-CoA synthetase (AMP-forming)/AMP-acid ligase II|nr:acyl--CoA ligase [Oscillospiraceae bacterium]
MPIPEILEHNAQQWGREVALVEVNPDKGPALAPDLSWNEAELVMPDLHPGYRKTLTWQEFDAHANRIAHLLIARGVRKGDKVAILLMNCIEWLPIYFGVLKAGALAVPLNFRYAADEIRYCLDLADCSVLVFGAEFVTRVQAVQGEIPKVALQLYLGADCPAFSEDLWGLAAAQSSEKPAVEIVDSDEAAIYFSSGTTGFPKAILHNHAGLVSACVTEQAHHGQTHDDVFLCIPPLYHTGAKMHWFGSFLVGGRAVLLRGATPAWIVQTAARERASIVWLLVPWAQDILDAIESGDIELSQLELSAWRLMHIGAQPVPPSLVKRWQGVFPGHGYDTNYGLSESLGPGCVHLGMENTHKVGAIGVAGYGWQTRILDPDGALVPPGSVGELAVKGPGVMLEYYRDPAATAAVLRDGWLFTGDMAQEDAGGFIFLVDRKKDVIITGGENLYPVQIEDFLRAHPKIKDVAVIGLPDHRLGEIAAAIIEIKPGYNATEAEIMDFCAALPRYKRPRRIVFDQVPRNPTGKIEKPRLRKKYVGESLVAQQTQH